MLYYLHNNIIYSIDNSKYIQNINDLKLYIENNSNNYSFENIKLSYKLDRQLIIPAENDNLIANILYTLSIVPIKCNKHL
jgi:hypothetical protein